MYVEEMIKKRLGVIECREKYIVEQIEYLEKDMIRLTTDLNGFSQEKSELMATLVKLESSQ